MGTDIISDALMMSGAEGNERALVDSTLKIKNGTAVPSTMNKVQVLLQIFAGELRFGQLGFTGKAVKAMTISLLAGGMDDIIKHDISVGKNLTYPFSDEKNGYQL